MASTDQHGFKANKDHLTHEEMVGTIQRGKSVLYGGQIITKVENLPTKAQLTAGTDDAPQTADELKKERARIDRELALLETAEKNKVDEARGVGRSATK